MVVQPVVETDLLILKGNTHPVARPEFDRGPAPRERSTQPHAPGAPAQSHAGMPLPVGGEKYAA